MQKYLFLAALVAMMSPWMPLAQAGDKPPAEKAEAKAGHVESGQPGKAPVTKMQNGRLEMKIIGGGKVFTLGPDGKLRAMDFKGEIPANVLEKLPKELQEHLKKEAALPFPGGAFGNRSLKVIVDFDGEKREYTTEIVPDGKPVPVPELESLLKSHKEACDKLRKEAARKRAAEATGECPVKVPQRQPKESKESGDIAAKLDRVLDRLEHLEKEIQELKAKPNR